MFRIVLPVVAFVYVAIAFKFICPPESQWRIRAKGKCGSEKQYSCLFDENTNTYVESCNRKKDYVPAGHKYVMFGLPTDKKCNPDRYQPTKFWMNSNSRCVYLKSLCNELGQILLPSESAREDVKCRCDHMQGYAFVTTPAHLCYCKPEKEDCSCYIKQCGVNGILLSDYECMPENHSKENSKCHSLAGLSGKRRHDITSTREPPATDIDVSDGTNVESLTDFRTTCIICIFVTVVLFILVITVAAAIYRKRLRMDIKDLNAIQIGEFPFEGYLGKSSDTIITGIASEIIYLGQEDGVHLNTDDLDIVTKETSKYTDKLNHFHKEITPLKDTFKENDIGSDKSRAIAGNDIENADAEGQTNWFACTGIEEQRDIDRTGKIPFKPVKPACEGQKEICEHSILNGPLDEKADKDIDKEEIDEIQIDELQYDDNMRQSSDDINAMMTPEKISVQGKILEDSNTTGFSLVTTKSLNYKIIDQPCQEGTTSFMEAIKEGDFETAKILIEKGADIDYANLEGQTALWFACTNGNCQDVRFLIKEQCDVNRTDKRLWTPLKAAACGGHMEICELLISNGALTENADDEGWTPLMSACREGHISTVKLLIANGVEIDHRNNKSQTALFLASSHGKLSVVELLVEKGSDINKADKNRRTPLKVASWKGHEDVCKFLIVKGGDVNMADKKGWTPLLSVCSNGWLSVAEILLTHGANFMTSNNENKTPLWVACRSGSLATVHFLVEMGSNVNEIDTSHRTPLLAACSAGHEDVCKYLISRNADINKADKDGMTPFLVACENGNANIVALLLANSVNYHAMNNLGQNSYWLATHNKRRNIIILLPT